VANRSTFESSLQFAVWSAVCHNRVKSNTSHFTSTV
jgi:hypothetical protein